MQTVVVIGGGAAGLMASIAASSIGKKVILIEKNEKLGKKIYITGKGRCNVTSNKTIQEIIKNIPQNGKFMYKSLMKFSNIDLINMIEKKGIKLKVERGERVFPESDKSIDIIRCFEMYLKENNVEVHLNSKVNDIIKKDDYFETITANNDVFKSNSVIITTGGLSYPLTGSTGDGYRFARKFGHNITPIYGSLIPLQIKEKWVKDLEGLNLKNVSILFKCKGKEIYKDFGEMLFTTYGIEGPIVLSGSAYTQIYFPNEVDIIVDLKPALDYEKLDKRILRDFEKYKNEKYKDSLKDLFPSKLIPVIIELSNIDREKKVNEITKKERHNIIQIIKNLKMTSTSTRPIEEAIITRGGINIKEINPETMESNKIKGLYFAGEIIDVDALTGGFNLQIAFSTGYCAGLNC